MIPEGLGRLQPLLLASRSPQRRAILAMLGIDFEVVEPAYDEPPLAGEPGEIAVTHARAKAASVEGRCVLGVDTLVAVEGRVLGKPAGEEQAREYLTLLSGRTHTVHSGLCLRLDGVEHVRHAATDVTFAALEPSDVDWYLGNRASGATVPGATRCRAGARRWCDRSPATTRTWWACRSPR